MKKIRNIIITIFISSILISSALVVFAQEPPTGDISVVSLSYTNGNIIATIRNTTGIYPVDYLMYKHEAVVQYGTFTTTEVTISTPYDGELVPYELVVDQDNKILENNESNNNLYGSIPTQDIAAKLIMSSETLTATRMITFYAEITRTGGISSQLVKSDLYVNGGNLGPNLAVWNYIDPDTTEIFFIGSWSFDTDSQICLEVNTQNFSDKIFEENYENNKQCENVLISTPTPTPTTTQTPTPTPSPTPTTTQTPTPTPSPTPTPFYIFLPLINK